MHLLSRCLQYKPIHVTRFVIGGTIEERILKLQEKKQAVFEGTVGGDSAALGRLTSDDLQFLFGECRWRALSPIIGFSSTSRMFHGGILIKCHELRLVTSGKLQCWPAA